ncbi:chemotaxis protein CheY [Candidatus Magnetomorum sp. HK-1]|nr:chemotaxis protein CheY [Candidatus Magnetomorum sp. HK-1]
MDGLTAAKLIRSKETAGQHVPIIALTALAADNDKDDCLSAGMDAHLPKPVDPHDMLMVIEQYLKAPKHQNTISTPEIRLMPGKRFDIDELKKKYDNDMVVICKKLNQFKEHGEVLLNHIETTVSDGNDLLLGKYVHKLMNIASEAGARKISDNAFRCKLALRKEDINKANQMISKMKEEYELFVSEIQYI